MMCLIANKRHMSKFSYFTISIVQITGILVKYIMKLHPSAMGYFIFGSQIFMLKTGIILRHDINCSHPHRNSVNNEVFSIPIWDETTRGLKMFHSSSLKLTAENKKS